MWWKHFTIFMIFFFTFFIQVKRSVKSKFIHLKKHQQMLWSHFLTQEGSLYPHMEMLIEILLVLQGSSAVVEQGISTLHRILRENRLAMSNERLNQLLTVKINLPVLHNLIKDCNVILKECIRRYYQKKKLRWPTHKEANSNEEPCGDIYGAPPPIKKWVIDLEEENPIDLSGISDDESYNEDIPVDSNNDSEWMNDKLRWTYFVRRLLDCKNEEFQIQPKWHWLKRKLR